MHEPQVLFETLIGPHGGLGMITLNRPNQLNALDQKMCIDIFEKLRIWERDPSIQAVIIRGAGERAFCAGGDIRKVYDLRATPLEAKDFFWHEYRLNHAIHHFAKPYISLLDGITMGGGAGLSVNGHYRVATEKLKFAMPETGIGFFPDVGGSYFLPRCPGKLGLYLALTGVTISFADAYYTGLANYVVSSETLPMVIAALQAAPWGHDAHVITRQVLQEFALPEPEAPLVKQREKIDESFKYPTVEAMVAHLQQQKDAWSQETAELILSRSPTSAKVVLAQQKHIVHFSFNECMRMEYRVMQHFIRGHDFFEGVRAALVDKDRAPKWQPNRLADVTAEEVERYFEKIPGIADLELEEELELSVV